MTLLRIERCGQRRQWMQAGEASCEIDGARLSGPHSIASSQNERPHLRIPRVWRARPRISRAIDTPRKKPLQKCEKLPCVQSRNMKPRDKAKAPPAVNKFLCRVTLPPDWVLLRGCAWGRSNGRFRARHPRARAPAPHSGPEIPRLRRPPLSCKTVKRLSSLRSRTNPP